MPWGLDSKRACRASPRGGVQRLVRRLRVRPGVARAPALAGRRPRALPAALHLHESSKAPQLLAGQLVRASALKDFQLQHVRTPCGMSQNHHPRARRP